MVLNCDCSHKGLLWLCCLFLEFCKILGINSCCLWARGLVGTILRAVSKTNKQTNSCSCKKTKKICIYYSVCIIKYRCIFHPCIQDQWYNECIFFYTATTGSCKRFNVLMTGFSNLYYKRLQVILSMGLFKVKMFFFLLLFLTVCLKRTQRSMPPLHTRLVKLSNFVRTTNPAHICINCFTDECYFW